MAIATLGVVLLLSSTVLLLLLAAGFGVLAMLLASLRFGIEGSAEEDLTPVHPWQPPQAHGELDPMAGPVLVTIEYRIDPARAADLARAERIVSFFARGG